VANPRTQSAPRGTAAVRAREALAGAVGECTPIVRAT
jgi:hypothetical protein